MTKITEFSQLKEYKVRLKDEPIDEFHSLYENKKNIHIKNEKHHKPYYRNNSSIENFKKLDIKQKIKYTEILSEMLDIKVPTNIRTKITNIAPFKCQKPLYILDLDTYINCPYKSRLIKLVNSEQKTITCCIDKQHLNENLGKTLETLYKNGFTFTLDINGYTDFNTTKTLIDEFNTVRGYVKVFTDRNEIKACSNIQCEVFGVNKKLQDVKLTANQLRYANLINTKDFGKILYWYARVLNGYTNKYNNQDTDMIYEIYPQIDETTLDEIKQKLKYWIK